MMSVGDLYCLLTRSWGKTKWISVRKGAARIFCTNVNSGKKKMLRYDRLETSEMTVLYTHYVDSTNNYTTIMENTKEI